MENGLTAAQGALFHITTYLNFDLRMHLSLQFACFYGQSYRTWIFDLLPRLKDGECLNCSPMCWTNDARSVNKFCNCDRWCKIVNLLSQLKDGEWLNCSPRCFVSYHNLPEFWYPDAFLPLILHKIIRYGIVSVDFTNQMKKNQIGSN